MNKAYLLAPLLLLLVFTGFYAAHRSDFKQREVARSAKNEAALKAKNEADLAARKAAMADAIQAIEQRKKEKDAGDALDKAQREIRQLALDARDKAYREQEKSAKQIERLKADIETAQAALAKLAAARKEDDAEAAFLNEFIVKSQANVQALQTLLAKLNAPAAPAK